MRTHFFAIACTLLLAGPVTAQPLTVQRVIDGDTFLLSDGQRVRLIGIDTPEKHVSEKLHRDAARTGTDIRTIQLLGERATRHAEGLVEGQVVELEYDRANAATAHRDRYGRTLAYVWVSRAGRRLYMVNERMLADGYANVYTAFPFQYADRFRALEREARIARRGLWADP